MQNRRFIRANFNTTGELRYGNEILTCKLLNLSLKGALIELEDKCPLKLDGDVKLKIKLVNSSIEINTEGMVVHKENQCLGIKFDSIDLDGMIHLRKLLEYNTEDPEQIENELANLGD